ncbi:MAG TPA: hypothetical protein VHC39_09145 [Rhizomicrobium sp.]|nr:hypothetical protein [Rhizomicrobium sp.]
MKFAAIAITLAFAATPALAQQGYPSATSPSAPSASPSPMDQTAPVTTNNDATRLASNRHHKRSQSSTSMGNGQSQMDNSQAQSNSGGSAGGGSAMPNPAPQQ